MGEDSPAMEPISLAPHPDYETFTFSIPGVFEHCNGTIKEVAMDSACKINSPYLAGFRRIQRHSLYCASLGKCATGAWELFALMGERRGSGLVLGYLLVRRTGKGKPEANAKASIIEEWLHHFRDQYSLDALFTLSDKDPSEIAAMGSVWPKAKHQLCFWHFLRALKKRLSILRRQPAYYNAEAAHQQFSWIDKDFVPRGQLSEAQVCLNH